MDNNLKTYGDLKQAIQSIAKKQKTDKIAGVAVDAILDFVPGYGAAKTTFQFIKAAVTKPDGEKSQTWLDRLDIDDKMAAIVDNNVENGFMQTIAKAIDSESDEKPLEPDFNMNAKMVNYLQDKYQGRHIAGIKEIEELHEGEFCPQCLAQYIRENINSLQEAEYKGRKVQLGKPMAGDVKKFKVYVKNAKGNVVKVNFGQKGVKIKKNNPERRKSFRARHHCDTNPGPRWKARYWSCRKW